MYRILKRVFDILLACIVLSFVFILFIICIIILLFSGEHYIWYVQDRIGYKNKHFNIIKFATMLHNSPNMGNGSLTTRNDPRVLPFGKFLRITKINELPQIFNVLNGTMSFVGPRPQMEVDFYRYPKNVQEKIYDSIPGITGIGSIIFRDEELYLSKPNCDVAKFYIEKIAPYKGELELWYLENKNLIVDFKIIILTAWMVIYPKSKLPYALFNTLPVKPQWMEE